MKFLERALLLMVAIGYWLAVIRQPADMSLFLICGAALALYYVVMMPVLLKGLPAGEVFRRGGWRLSQLIAGLGLGLAYGYAVLCFVFHNLGWMDSLALAENCGLLLAGLALPAWLHYRRSKDLFFKRFLIRIAVLAAALCLSLALHPFLIPNEALERMNPL